MKITDNPNESEVKYLPKPIKEKIEEIKSRQKEMDWTKTIDPYWQKILKWGLPGLVFLGIVVSLVFHFFPDVLTCLFPGAVKNTSTTSTSQNSLSILSDERYKILYEFVVLIIIGGAVSSLYKRYATIRDRREHYRQLLKEFRKEAIAAYNQTKANRRLFRIKIVSSSGTGDLQSSNIHKYEQLIEKLIEPQLSLEALKRRVSAELHFLPDHDVVEMELESAEKYLNKILDVYINIMKRRQAEKDDKGEDCLDLKFLQSFLGRARIAREEAEKFRNEEYPKHNVVVYFFAPLDECLKRLAKAIAT